jgi:hypothetical protein
MARTERLLQSLSDEQKPAFEALLANAANDRDEIQVELNELYHILDQYKSSDHPAE